MVEKLDKNDEKFYTLLEQYAKDRKADKEQTDQYIQDANVKFDKMMDKIDKNSEKANVKFDKIMDKLDKNSEESNIKFDRVMSRLEKQGEENLRKIELMEKRFENKKRLGYEGVPNMIPALMQFKRKSLSSSQIPKMLTN